MRDLVALKRLERDGLLRYQRKEVTIWLDRGWMGHVRSQAADYLLRASQVENPLAHSTLDALDLLAEHLGEESQHAS